MIASILNTRPVGQCEELSSLLYTRGYNVFEFSPIEINFDEGRRAIQSMDIEFFSEDWVVFTSKNGVQSVWGVSELREQLTVPHVAVVGEGTARVASKLGCRVNLIASKPNSSALTEELLLELGQDEEIGTVYVFQAQNASEMLSQTLKQAGYNVVVCHAYESRPVNVSLKDLMQLGKFLGIRESGTSELTHIIQAIVATSAYSVKTLMSILDKGKHLWVADWYDKLLSIPICVIGPKTELAVRSLGYSHIIEAREASCEAIADAVASIVVS